MGGLAYILCMFSSIYEGRQSCYEEGRGCSTKWQWRVIQQQCGNGKWKSNNVTNERWKSNDVAMKNERVTMWQMKSEKVIMCQ